MPTLATREELIFAMIHLTDGQTVRDLQNLTGLTAIRCQEILDTANKCWAEKSAMK